MNGNDLIFTRTQRRLQESKQISASIQQQQQDRLLVDSIVVETDASENTTNNLSSTIVCKAFTFTKINNPVLNNLLVAANITNFPDYEYLLENNVEELQQKINLVVCANQTTLTKIVETRNIVLEEINKLTNYYRVVDTTINNISNILNTQVELVKALESIKLVASQAVKLIPSPPGTPGITTALLSDIDSLVKMIIYSSTGAPKLETIKQSIVLAQLLFQQAMQILNVFLTKFTILDMVLKKCNQEIQPINQTFTQFANIYKPIKTEFNYSSEPYKGFTLVIETNNVENSTLTQKRAVAFTPSGIPVISTAYSYTTKPSLLFEQLKFTITSQNLKAN